MKTRQKLALLGLPIAAAGVFAEVAGAKGSTLASSQLCMNALTFVALVLTPTATVGEVLTQQVDRFRPKNGKK